MQNISQMINTITHQLSDVAGSKHAGQLEAWWLLEKLTGKKKVALLIEQTTTLTPEQEQQLEAWLHQRIKDRKPLQYILGLVPFCGLEILVEPPVLIPRPETEEWVTWLIEQLKPVADKPLHILDLCSGSGCIALALAQALPASVVIGLDIEPKAVALAEKNKQHNKVTNAQFKLSDLYHVLGTDQTFDLIVSNPPYITPEEFEKLSPEVQLWEDKKALVAQKRGMEIYERIVQESPRFLTKSSVLTARNLPRIVLELGNFPEEVGGLLEGAGYSNIRLHQDMQKSTRWVEGAV